MRAALQRVVSIWLLLALGLPAPAQAPEIAGILPAGGQRATSTVIHVDGRNLKNAQVMLSGSGVRVEKVEANAAGDQATVHLAIASDAPLGPREMRLWTPGGVSNPGRLWIDVFPEQMETEPNDNAAHAQTLDRFPVVVNGRIQAPTDQDVFAIRAGAGETWVFDCNAARLISHLDPMLELRNEAGQPLDMAQSLWESDPRLIYRFTKAGRYFLTLRDTQFLGGPDYVYRLTVGKLPTLTGFLPRGGRPGETVMLQAEGVNLGAAKSLQVALPADAAPDDVWVSPETENGPALPIRLLVDTLPVVSVGKSPGDMPLPAPPCLLDSLFTHSPRQRFTLRAAAKERLEFDLLGRRISSRIDGALRVLDAAGKEIAANDDAVGKDARLEFTAPAAGVYTLEVRNVGEATGPDCFYRLAVRRAEPDFKVMLSDDRLHVGAGGTTAVTVTAERLHGFDGPITITAEALPKGAVCRGGVIAPGRNTGELTLTAPPDTPLGASIIRLRGTATIAGRTIAHNVVPREQYLPRAIDPGMFTDDSYRRPYHDCEILPLGVVPRAEPFALETTPETVTLAPGQHIEITVRAVRRPGADGEITLELGDLPGKVKAELKPIPAHQTESRILLTAAPDAPAAVRSLVVRGHLDKTVEPAPAVTLTVRR
jgi:hypothetical protein